MTYGHLNELLENLGRTKLSVDSVEAWLTDIDEIFTVTNYEEGALHVDNVYDTKDELVWVGLSEIIDNMSDEEKNQDIIVRGIENSYKVAAICPAEFSEAAGILGDYHYVMICVKV